MNYADASRIKAILINAGREYVESIKSAAIVIIDTCSVRQKSEDKVTWKLKEIPSNKNIRITGCMIQHNLRNAKIAKKLKNKKGKIWATTWNFVWNIQTQKPRIVWFSNQELQELTEDKENTNNIIYINHAYNPMFYNINKSFPNVELFFRIDDTGLLPIIIEQLGYEIKPNIEILNEYTNIIPHSTNQLFKENTKTAYVPISTGCSQFCAYCIVPYARGLEKNLSKDHVIAEVKHHIKNGIEEIVLLWQIVNKHPDFVEICKQILKIPWLRWLRYTSPYPTYTSQELLKLHENEEKMCPHIHMPLQSWSDAVLKRMFRGYTAWQYKEFIDQIRSLKRPISITSDIILWFSDESETDFQQSLDVATYANFDMIYMGIYSPRPWTLWAKKYKDNISKKTKKERRARMNSLLTEMSWQNNQKEIGSKREIIINKIEKERISWYTDNMKNVIIKIDKKETTQKWKQEWTLLGKFTKVEIIAAESFKLFAKQT